MGFKEDFANAVPQESSRHMLREKLGYEYLRQSYSEIQATELQPLRAFRNWATAKLDRLSQGRKREWSGAIKPSPCQAQQSAMDVERAPSPGDFGMGKAQNEDLDEEGIWKRWVKNNDFCARVRVNNWWKDPVAQTPPLYSRLRFLKLCMISGRSVECKAAFQNMLLQRQKRKSKAQEDKRATPAALELDYHPLVHAITQAAAEGLSKFRVGKEERKAGNKAREDVRGYVSDPFTDNYEFALPQEVKKDYRLASTQDPDGVHSNYLGLGKGVFLSRCESLWLARFTFESRLLEEIEVSPAFPNMDQVVPDLYLSKYLRYLDDPAVFNSLPESSLSGLLQMEEIIPPGFEALVGIYHRTVIEMGHTIDPILWLNLGANKREDITSASIVSASHKSVLVYMEGLGENVLKILDKASFDREVRMQSMAYGLSGVRQMEAQGPIAGCGNGLYGLLLKGFYTSHLSSLHIERIGLQEVSVQLYNAVKDLHSRGIYHRDLKPANFYCDSETKQVKISDLGSGCSSQDPQDVLKEESGSEMYRSPRRAISGTFQPIDDITSLALALAQMIGALSATDKVSQHVALRIMSEKEERPQAFKQELLHVLSLIQGLNPWCKVP